MEWDLAEDEKLIQKHKKERLKQKSLEEKVKSISPVTHLIKSGIDVAAIYGFYRMGDSLGFDDITMLTGYTFFGFLTLKNTLGALYSHQLRKRDYVNKLSEIPQRPDELIKR